MFFGTRGFLQGLCLRVQLLSHRTYLWFSGYWCTVCQNKGVFCAFNGQVWEELFFILFYGSGIRKSRHRVFKKCLLDEEREGFFLVFKRRWARGTWMKALGKVNQDLSIWCHNVQKPSLAIEKLLCMCVCIVVGDSWVSWLLLEYLQWKIIWEVAWHYNNAEARLFLLVRYFHRISRQAQRKLGVRKGPSHSFEAMFGGWWIKSRCREGLLRSRVILGRGEVADRRGPAAPSNSDHCILYINDMHLSQVPRTWEREVMWPVGKAISSIKEYYRSCTSEDFQSHYCWKKEAPSISTPLLRIHTRLCAPFTIWKPAEGTRSTDTVHLSQSIVASVLPWYGN